MSLALHCWQAIKGSFSDSSPAGDQMTTEFIMVSSVLANSRAGGEVGGVSFTGTAGQSGAHQRELTSARPSSGALQRGAAVGTETPWQASGGSPSPQPLSPACNIYRTQPRNVYSRQQGKTRCGG